jgi:hypothetical protein
VIECASMTGHDRCDRHLFHAGGDRFPAANVSRPFTNRTTSYGLQSHIPGKKIPGESKLSPPDTGSPPASYLLAILLLATSPSKLLHKERKKDTNTLCPHPCS